MSKLSETHSCIVRLAIDLFKAEEEITALKEQQSARENWLRKAKRNAGYPDNISFDVVWDDALRALKKQKKEK